MANERSEIGRRYLGRVRWHDVPPEQRFVRVRLLRKLADMIDGVDLLRFCVGEVIELSERDANILIAEGWAVPAEASASRVGAGPEIDSIS